MTAPPTPGRDSRVEKLAQAIGPVDRFDPYVLSPSAILDTCESAGLLVLDPSPELVERIAGAIRLAAQRGLIQSDSLASAVLAALAPDAVTPGSAA